MQTARSTLSHRWERSDWKCIPEKTKIVKIHIRFSSSIVRDPFCVQIWATNSFWRLRNPLPKLIGVVANYLFPKSGPNQNVRSSTENFFLGVRISSFFFVKGMCWGVQEKIVPAWFPSILVPENAGVKNFALSSGIVVCTYKERENSSIKFGPPQAENFGDFGTLKCDSLRGKRSKQVPQKSQNRSNKDSPNVRSEPTL